MPYTAAMRIFGRGIFAGNINLLLLSCVVAGLWAAMGLSIVAAETAAFGSQAHEDDGPGDQAASVQAPGTRVIQDPLADKINGILAAAELEHAQIGIRITTLTGQSLYALNEARLFTPASNTKLATTAAASALLPPALTWTTQVVASGEIDDVGVLHGDLILLGSGDPTLSGRIYPYRERLRPGSASLGALATARPDVWAPLDELAAQVAKAGVRQVAGGVIGDDTFFVHDPYGKGWEWDDLQWPYGAPVSALSYNDNSIELSWPPRASSSASPTASGSVLASASALPFSLALPFWTPELPYYTIQGSMTAAEDGSAAQPGLDRPPGSRVVRVWGTVPATGFHANLAIEDPAEFAAMAFKEALRRHGVRVSGTTTARHRPAISTVAFAAQRAAPIVLRMPSIPQGTDRTTVAAPVEGLTVVGARFSASLAEEIVMTNKTSLNLHAELLLRLLGKLIGDDGSAAQGARVVRQFLLTAGADEGEFSLWDGSGASTEDRISPRAVTKLLIYAAQQPWGRAWRESLPVAGVDGTLAGRFGRSVLKGRIQAKTGTMSDANILSGYLSADSGRTVVFSIFINSHRPGSDGALRAIDHICEAIAATE